MFVSIQISICPNKTCKNFENRSTDEVFYGQNEFRIGVFNSKKSHDPYMCYNEKCKNIPAPLIIDPDVLLVLLQSLSVLNNEFFTTGGISLLPGQIILCDQIGS